MRQLSYCYCCRYTDMFSVPNKGTKFVQIVRPAARPPDFPSKGNGRHLGLLGNSTRYQLLLANCKSTSHPLRSSTTFWQIPKKSKKKVVGVLSCLDLRRAQAALPTSRIVSVVSKFSSMCWTSRRRSSARRRNTPKPGSAQY